MKKSIITLIAILVFTFSYGQDTKHAIGINLGVASPTGDFAKAKDSDKAGFATAGLSLGLDYAFYFHKNLAATFVARSSAYSINDDKLEKLLEDEFAAENIDATVISDSDPYTFGFVGIGIRAEIGSEIVKAYINPYLGSGSLTFPEREMLISPEGSTGYVELDSDDDTDSKFMFGVNFGVDFKLSKLVSLGLNFETASAKDFKFVIESTADTYDNGRRINREKESEKGKLSYSTLNTTVRLAFHF